MRSAIVLRLAIFVAAAGLVAGCSSRPSVAKKSWLPGLPFAKRQPQGLPLSGAPDPSKTYQQYQAEHQQRKVVSPALGYEGDTEPGRLARMKSAVGGSRPVRALASVFKWSPRSSSGNSDLNDPVALSAKSQPPGADLHVGIAQAQERSGNIAGAAQQYQRALALDPQHRVALVGYARLLDRQGKFPEAAQLYERAVAVSPRDPAPLNDLALCRARQKQLDSAVNAMSRAVELDPKRALYRNNLAKLLVETDRPEAAFEQLVAVHPPAVAHYNLGYLLAQKGDRSSAVRHFNRSEQLDPSLADARHWSDLLAERPVSPDLEPQRQAVQAPAGPSPGTGPAVVTDQPAGRAPAATAAQSPVPAAGPAAPPAAPASHRVGTSPYYPPSPY